MDCVFCNIASGKIPSNLVYQDNELVAFPDLHPKAPIHILIIPRKHIQSLNALPDDDVQLIPHMIKTAKLIAREKGIFDNGYKLVINTGKEGGQVIQHLHMHMLGGRHLKD
jgi:histidine triad (HIT) family protein